MSDPQNYPPVAIKRTRGIYKAVVPGDDRQAEVYWHPKKSGFILRWKLDGKWYYQWLMWSCRAGKKSYFRPMVALYRALIKDGLCKRGTLKKLAC